MLLYNAVQVHVALPVFISSLLIVFDLEFNFVTQVVNLHTNKVARIIGKVENTERFLRIALYQGGFSSKKVKKLPAAAANVNEQREPLTDPTLLCCAFKKHRLYLFRCINIYVCWD